MERLCRTERCPRRCISLRLRSMCVLFRYLSPTCPYPAWMPVRLAGFRLIEAGMEHKPGIECTSSLSPPMPPRNLQNSHQPSSMCSNSPVRPVQAWQVRLSHHPFLPRLHDACSICVLMLGYVDVGDLDLAAGVLGSAAKVGFFPLMSAATPKCLRELTNR